MDSNTVDGWLKLATAKLQKAGIASARLDALILLEDITGLDRTNLLAHPEKSIQNLLLRQILCKSGNELPFMNKTGSGGLGSKDPISAGIQPLEKLNEGLERRIKGEPLAYIRGFVEFYGHRFVVNHNVLVPRPESEAFLQLLHSLKPVGRQTLIDIGTGSGVLAISAKLKYPALTVCATDISANALKVAKANAKQLGVEIVFKKINLLTKQTKQIDYILANLPYVPNGYKVEGIDFEPNIAIFAGHDGLKLINKLSLTAYKLLNTNGYILIESLEQQHNAIYDIYTDIGFSLIGRQGLVQVFQKST